MPRSKWKGPYLPESLSIKTIRESEISSKNNLKIFSRNSVILPIHVNRILHVYNGKRFVKLKVSEEMIGHKFGEFSPTRIKFSFKKKKII